MDMELTPDETRLVSRLRAREHQWLVNRWIIVFGGIFIYLSHGYLVVLMYQRDQFMEVSAEEVLLWPLCLIIFFVASCAIAIALADWRGNPTRVLLLKMLDAGQSRESDDEHTA